MPPDLYVYMPMLHSVPKICNQHAGRLRLWRLAKIVQPGLTNYLVINSELGWSLHTSCLREKRVECLTFIMSIERRTTGVNAYLTKRCRPVSYQALKVRAVNNRREIKLCANLTNKDSVEFFEEIVNQEEIVWGNSEDVVKL